jgi:ligand-binding sensor domain-containing protein
MTRVFVKKLFFLLLILSLYFPGTAQLAYSRIFEIAEDQPSITAKLIFKDHNGFLWIASNAGLFRFNGLRTQAIALPGDTLLEVTAIGEDMDATIWIGFQNGAIATVRNNLAKWFLPEEGLPKVAITSFFYDKAQRTWFGTAGEGVYYQEGRHLYNINDRDGLTDNYVYTLSGDSGNTILAGTDRGLSFIEITDKHKQIKKFTAKDGLPDNIVRSITPSDLPGYWWVGMQDKGFCLFDVNKRQLANSHISSLWKYGQVNDILDLGNELWIATEESGVWVYDKQQHDFRQQLFSTPLNTDKVSDLQADNQGNIWLTNSRFINRTTGNHFLFYKQAGRVSLKRINAVLANGTDIWVADGAKLYKYFFDGNRKEQVNNYTLSIQNADITCLYKDAQGFLWIGTMGKGLVRMDMRTGAHRTIIENPLLQNGHILSVTGNQNTVWIASLNGITQLEVTDANQSLSAVFAYRNYGKADGIGSDYVYHLYMDSKNRLWLATDGAGVALREDGRFSSYFGEKQMKAKVVYSVTEDINGNIWFNTLNEGIYKYDGKEFNSITTSTGLSDINLTSLASDNSHGLVTANKNGIDVFDTKNNSVYHFGKESGIEVPQSALNAISKDANGCIWLGMENGLLRYTPYLHKQQPPLMVIEKVEIFNNVIDTSKPHVYSYLENNFRFFISGIYYTEPEKLKYQYQLTGYNNKWETTSDNSIIFPKLSDGNYMLKVRASITGNFDNAVAAVYSFKIERPFWRQWWFIALGLILISAVLYALVRIRVKKIKSEERLKNERFRFEYDALKSQVNPHFLFNSFNALMGVIEDNPAEAGEFVRHLSAFYRKMTAYRDKDIILLKEELGMLDTYLFIQKKRYGNALQATINVDAYVQENTSIPPLSLQLLAENAVKHNAISMESPLFLEIKVENSFLWVINNINPKIKEERGEGVGLQNIANRFRMLCNAPIIFENKNNKFIVKLPLLNIK